MTRSRTKKTLFISHKHSDSDVAKAFQKLAIAAINGLDAKQIVRTSGADTGVQAGAYITDTLLDDIRNCKAFVALISEAYLTSPYCLMEYAAWLGLKIRTPPIPLHYPTLDRNHLPGMLPGAKLIDITDKEKIKIELRNIVDCGEDGMWSLAAEEEFDKELKGLVRIVKRQRPQRWMADNFLIRDKKADFLNVYGLQTDFRKDGVVQDFSLHVDCDPVQFAWADSRTDSRIKAKWLAKENLLRLDFDRREGYGCNITIRPLEDQAVLRGNRQKLYISARVAPGSELDGVGLNVRLVNGYMQHWRLMKDPDNRKHLIFDSEEFQDHPISLEPDLKNWQLFGMDGTGPRGPTEIPNFDVIAAINLAPGSPSSGIGPVREGRGVLDVRKIWLA